ncbi:hypothetical protein DY000_02003501 [Brassica cretica]|uniref:Uncharacterized protein n=1 Tax=Brassica cretica TaxID=69181 RepID=A0ABQ7C7P9_BRACR|nr:hypothetical protein DY000_02003501 [Brassica cretica]
MMKALKDISKSHNKSTSTRAPVAEPSLIISEKPKELTVLQPEHPSSLVLSQQEDEPGPVFDDEATRITSIVMESHLCFDPGTTPALVS